MCELHSDLRNYVRRAYYVGMTCVDAVLAARR